MIAHEFNNLLTVIQGDVGLLQVARPGHVDRRRVLDQIMQASQRAATFTRQLLAFSRKQVLQPGRSTSPASCNAWMRSSVDSWARSSEIELDCPRIFRPSSPTKAGLEQILINLVLNARDAMPEGGAIQIGTSLAILDATAATANPDARPGRFIRLTVTDHGCGMTPQILERIFDPFFTTKDVGKGTGLGLSTIHGIVKQHDGWIEVTSQVGKGSTFKVFLPATREKPPTSPAKTADDPVPARGKGETVLLVEDEHALRDMAGTALKKRGYNVLKAGDGPQALQVWERASTPVDLLLTDMVMPCGMSGSALAKTLQARNPKLKVIFTSGYSPELMEEDSFPLQKVNFLPKPYDIHALFEAVRLCLDGGTLPPCEVHLAQSAGSTK